MLLRTLAWAEHEPVQQQLSRSWWEKSSRAAVERAQAAKVEAASSLSRR